MRDWVAGGDRDRVKKKKSVLVTRALVFYQRNTCVKDKLKKT